MIITRCFFALFVALGYFCVHAENGTDFFKEGNARFTGIVKDYDSGCGFDNMQILTFDGFSGKELFINVPVKEDGTFQVDVPMSYPRLVHFRGLSGQYRFIYLEPECDLNLVIGVDTIYRYEGTLGEINRQFAEAPQYLMENNSWMAHELTPKEASERLKEISDNYQMKIDDYIKGKEIHPVAEKLLNNRVKMIYFEELLNYDFQLNYVHYDDSLAPSLKEPMTAEFFKPIADVLKENDPKLLSADYRTLPLAFSSVFKCLGFEDVYEVSVIDRGLLFLKEKGLELNESESDAARWLEENLGKRFFFNEEEWQAYFAKQVLAEDVAKRYGLMDELVEFQSTLPQALYFTPNSVELKNMTELLKSYAGIDFSPILWQTSLCDYLCRGKGITKDYSDKGWTFSLIESITRDSILTTPECGESMREFFTELYDDEPYELPDDENGRVMKKIIEPFRGKYVLIDFWATYCGPCRAEIEGNEDIYRRNIDHPQFQFVFITADTESPRKLYDEYASKHLDGLLSLYLPGTEFARLRKLFNFNGVPRYVLIDPEGKVIDDNLRSHDLSSVLEKYGVILR